MVLYIVQSKLSRDTHVEEKVCFGYMFTLYRIVKRSVAETDPVQFEQEQELCCAAGITSLENGAKQSCSKAEIVGKVAFL